MNSLSFVVVKGNEKIKNKLKKFDHKKKRSIISVEWWKEENVIDIKLKEFFVEQSYAMLEVGCQNDVMLYVTVYCGKESLSHLFDVTPNETGEYDELYYFSDDGGSIIYYPSTQSIFYDNNQGLLSGMYY